MLFVEERELIIKYGKKLVDANLTSGTGGNLSVYDPKTKLMAITPSGLDFYAITVDDIVVMTLDGEVIEGELKPSSEWIMHAVMYQNREDMTAIIHAHTVYATVLSCLREPLLPTHYMVAVAGKSVQVAEYATFGTQKLAENALKALGNDKAVLLANHGLIGGESSLKLAFNVIEEVEYCAKIYCLAKNIGNPVILPDDEMEVMAEKFKSYGKPMSLQK